MFYVWIFIYPWAYTTGIEAYMAIVESSSYSKTSRL